MTGHRLIKVLEGSELSKRIAIYQREDGKYTYHSEKFDQLSGEWSKGLDKGIYDSALTAETEARQREHWLRERFH